MITTNAISIALANNNVERSNKYDNVILFNNDSEILSYLGITDADFKPYNFPLFSSTKPRDVVIDLSSTNKNVYDIVNSNYFVAKLETSDGKTKYYYYFVNSATQSTQTTFVLTLTLDVFTTYKLNVDFQIKNVLTERKHCDRLRKMSTSMLAYNNNPSSEVMIEDDIEQAEYPKYIKRTYNPVNRANASNETLWLYLYVSLPVGVQSPGDKTDGQIISGMVGTSYEQYYHTNYTYKFNVGTTENNFAVLVAPLEAITVNNIPFKSENATSEDEWWGREGYEWSANNLIKTFGKGLASNNGRYTGTFKVYGANIGYLPPLKLPSGSPIDYSQLISITNMQVVFSYVELNSGNYTSDNAFAPFLLFSKVSMAGDTVCNAEFQIEDILGKFQITPTKTKTPRDMEYEPKLYKSAFRSIRLKSNISEVYKDYPLLNILGLENSAMENTSQIMYAEIPAIDGITCFSTITDKGLFSEYTIHNVNDLLGNIYKNNFSFAITSDQYTDYLLNNKNAYLTGIVLPTATKVISGATNIIGQKNTPNIVKSLVDTAVDTVGSIANFNLKIDNLQNAPDSLKYLQSNAIESFLVPSFSFAPYIEYWQAYEVYLELAYNYFYTMGYKVNKFTSSGEWNNRYYFNYVKTAESCESKIFSTKPLSLEIKTLISNALQNGITFWNYISDFTYLDYTMENWENDLL